MRMRPMTFHLAILDNKGILPSWVPNWNIIYRPTLLPWATSDHLEAPKAMLLVLYSDDSSDLREFAVEAIEVGTVDYRKSVPYDSYHGISNNFS